MDRIHINVSMTKGAKNRCPICGKKSSGYDQITKSRKWRHLDFGSCMIFIESDVNRVKCKVHGVHTEAVPWAFHHTNFTKEFEQQLAFLAIHLNRTQASVIMRVAWNTVGPIISRFKNILEPNSATRFHGLKRIGIDETRYRKGHKYITVVVDHDTNQIVWVGQGASAPVLDKFMSALSIEQRNNIELVSADGARWIKKCVNEWLPNAELCIDGFHVVSWAIEALDTLRKDIKKQIKLNEYKCYNMNVHI